VFCTAQVHEHFGVRDCGRFNLSRGTDLIRHVALWRLYEQTEASDRAAKALSVKAALENLVGKIDGLLRSDVGIFWLECEQADEVILDCDFRDWAALEAFREHPLYVSAISLLNTLPTERIVMEWEPAPEREARHAPMSAKVRGEVANVIIRKN